MNVSNTALGSTKSGNRFGILFLSFLIWFLHRYNKTNKVVNVWERSQKDINTHGVNNQIRACISRDNRVHIRWQTWSIYIGQPWSLKTEDRK